MVIRLKIKTIYHDLSPKDQIIADYILENTSKVAKGTINDISHDLGIADSTFFQFTKKLGFKGFKDFKMYLLTQEPSFSNVSVHENIDEHDTELTIATKVFEADISTLNDTKRLLKQEDLKKAAQIINSAKSIHFFGVGGSEIIAKDAHHKFLRTSIFSTHNTDFHIQLMQATLLTPKDCAFLISHTGHSQETIKLAQVAKEAGAKIIILTSNANSPLAKLGDVVFLSLSEETEFRSEALASRIAQLSIIDSLYVIAMVNNKEKSEQFISKIRRTIYDIKK
jgi:DNA-binding MurR/RpiR family transcriptional regulator